MKYILFDLDGTLLDNDMSIFMPQYFSLLSKKLSPFIKQPLFLEALLKASRAMISDYHPSLTNKQVFWQKFLALTGLDYQTVSPLTEEFYINDFPSLKSLTRPMPGARELIEKLFAKGLKIVIATNPLFPKRAIKHRLQWAALDDFPFALITTYENMHTGKPRLEYYYEILSLIKAQPWQAIMVGNSLDEDMIAKKVGLFTFYLCGNSEAPLKSELVDWYGSLGDLRKVLLV